MNRYDYYTRRVNMDEQEWLTEELYYPEQEDTSRPPLPSRSASSSLKAYYDLCREIDEYAAYYGLLDDEEEDELWDE